MAGDPPHLTVVAETPDYGREKALAERDLAWGTRELAANLLRIMRGAGKPHELPQQIINLSDQILETSKSARAWAVWSAMEETLDSAIPASWDASEREESFRTIVRGSLQFAASRLVYQRAQEAAGTSEICDGIEQRERSLERMRERFRREQSDAVIFRKARKATAKVKAPKAAKATTPAKPKQAQPSPKPPTILAPEVEEPKTTVEFMKARKRELRGE